MVGKLESLAIFKLFIVSYFWRDLIPFMTLLAVDPLFLLIIYYLNCKFDIIAMPVWPRCDFEPDYVYEGALSLSGFASINFYILICNWVSKFVRFCWLKTCCSMNFSKFWLIIFKSALLYFSGMVLYPCLQKNFFMSWSRRNPWCLALFFYWTF